MRRALAVIATVAAVLLTGCGGNTGAGSNALDSRELPESAGPSQESSTASPAESPGDGTDDTDDTDDAATVVEIEIENGELQQPFGERVTATVGEPIVLEIESDRAGDIHVHSTPEQELEFGKGESTLRFTIDKPGVVDVEVHDLEAVVVQLEVS